MCCVCINCDAGGDGCWRGQSCPARQRRPCTRLAASRHLDPHASSRVSRPKLMPLMGSRPQKRNYWRWGCKDIETTEARSFLAPRTLLLHCHL